MTVRKHKGIYQTGAKKGKLKKGYRYKRKGDKGKSKTKSGLRIIVKVGKGNMSGGGKRKRYRMVSMAENKRARDKQARDKRANSKMKLPLEVMWNIGGYLDAPTLGKMSRTSKKMKNLHSFKLKSKKIMFEKYKKLTARLIANPTISDARLLNTYPNLKLPKHFFAKIVYHRGVSLNIIRELLKYKPILDSAASKWGGETALFSSANIIRPDITNLLLDYPEFVDTIYILDDNEQHVEDYIENLTGLVLVDGTRTTQAQRTFAEQALHKIF